MGTWRGAGLPELRYRLQVLHDLLMQFGVGQDREQLGRPARHAVVTPVLAGTALAQVAGQGQPQGSGQRYRAAPTVLLRIAIVAASIISQHLSQFPAPGSPDAGWVHGRFRGGEGGDLEGAQDGLPVLATQSPDLGNGRPELKGRVPAVQAPRHEQVVHPLPGFWQRGHDALQPLPQRCQPRGRVPHLGSAGGNAGTHCLPVSVIDPGGLPGPGPCLGRDAKQPATQGVRTRQRGGIGHGPAGGNENAGRGGDGRVGIGPEPLGAAAQHCVAMLANHVREHRRAFPRCLGLPEPLYEHGIGPFPVVCSDGCHPIHGLRICRSRGSRTRPVETSGYDGGFVHFRAVNATELLDGRGATRGGTPGR